MNEFVQLSLHNFLAFLQCASTDLRAGGFVNEVVQLSLHHFAAFPHGRSPDYCTNVKFPPKVEPNFQILNLTTQATF